MKDTYLINCMKQAMEESAARIGMKSVITKDSEGYVKIELYKGNINIYTAYEPTSVFSFVHGYEACLKVESL